MNKKLIILQMNEVNFHLVKKYISKGYLKNFKYFLDKYELVETSSEKNYENLEPWIQWVSFYSGKQFSEHKVSHLNDFDAKNWNFFSVLESKFKKKLALFFPMNLKNNFSENSFFLPDPWTDTKINADKNLKKIFEIFKKIILNNAANKIDFFDLVFILFFSIFKTSINFKLFCLKNFNKLIKYKFYKAIIFDYLCWEIFKKTSLRHNYDVLSLFLNACAHIQHHYYLSASVEKFEHKNPSWYIKNIDPVFECFNLYDNFLGEFKNYSDNEFLIITGLSQSPIKNPIYYYNLTNYKDFFNKLRIRYEKIIKRMSRDYTLYFKNEEDSNYAKNQLSKININGTSLFGLKNSQNRLYVELIYDKEIKEDDFVTLYEGEKLKIKENVNFIAIKNSIHNQKGYLISSIKEYKSPINIWDVHKTILEKYEA